MHPPAADHRPPRGKVFLEDGDISVLASREAAFAIVNADHTGWRESSHPHRFGERDTNGIAQDWYHPVQQRRAAGEGTVIEQHANTIVNLVFHAAHAEARPFWQTRPAGRVGNDTQAVG